MARKRVSKNIYYDASKKLYYVKCYHGKNELGKYVTTYITTKSKKDAEKKLTAFLHGKNTGTIASPSEHTVETWLEYWMTHVIEPNAQETTVYGYRQMMKNHIIPALGKVKLQKLTADQLQQYYTMKLEKLSPNTVLKHHNLMQTAFLMAEKQDIISRTPTNRVTPPRAIESEISFLTAEQLQALIEAAYEIQNDKHALLLTIVLAAYTGMRREEILGLTWKDVDFSKNIITVRKARTSAGSKIVDKRTKTSSSNRVIHMSDRVKLELIKVKMNLQTNKESDSPSKRFNPSGYIIVNDKGVPCRPNYISSVFRKLADKCGLHEITLHGLRHTFATLANDQGHTMYTISKAMGHSRPDITARIYTHPFDKANQELIESISTSIEGGLSEQYSNISLASNMTEQLDQNLELLEQTIKEQRQEIENKKALKNELEQKVSQMKLELEASQEMNQELESEIEKLRKEFQQLKAD